MAEYRSGDLIAGEFRILSFLGAGTFGRVFRVEWLEDHREYALKVFEASADRGQVERELSALRRIDHPHVVKVVGAGSLRDGSHYLQTQLVDGESLRNFVTAAQHLPVAEVLRLGVQLLSALEHIHPDEPRAAELRTRQSPTADERRELARIEATGLVHRDIKPDNIRLTDAGDLVLLDFGIASRAGTRVETRTLTEAYAPPDLAFDAWTPDVDLYATGVTLFELTTGRLPNVIGVDNIGVLNGARPGLPAKVIRFLLRGCSPERATRYATAAEMRVDAEGALAQLLGFEADEQREDAGSVHWLHDLPAYVPWKGRRLPSAAEMDKDSLVEALVDIVSSEGPMLCDRLYTVFVQWSSDPSVESVRSSLNRAAYAAVRTGRLEQIEPLGGGQGNKTVHLPGTSPVVIRARGDRLVQHIPRSEVAALGHQIAAELREEGLEDWAEEVPELVVGLYQAWDESPFAVDYLVGCLADLEEDPGDGAGHVDRTASSIEARMTAHFEDIGAHPIALDRDAWADLPPEPGNSRRALGFTMPLPDEGWMAPFCPAIIHETSAFLDDDSFQAYIDAVIYLVDTELTMYGVPATDRIAAADRQLLETAEGSMRLVSEVELHRLDSMRS